MGRPDSEIDRFFDNVTFGAEWGGSKCLVWNGKKPIFELDKPKGRRVDAIRYAYALEHGEEFLASGYVVTHRCKDPLCVNFQHILCIDADKHKRVQRELQRSDWCRNGEHLRAEFEKIDTYGRPFCGGCAEAADKRRRIRELKAKLAIDQS